MKGPEEREARLSDRMDSAAETREPGLTEEPDSRVLPLPPPSRIHSARETCMTPGSSGIGFLAKPKASANLSMDRLSLRTSP
jgi:hypothetical protein